MSDVFISYSRKNSDFARKLIEKIKAIGKDWWVDWEGIPLTSPNWWAEIKAGIENSDNFVFIMSPDSMASVVCNMELDYAIALGKRIVPVVYLDVQARDSFASIADFTPDPAMEERLGGRNPLIIARDNWQHLSHINWIFFRDSDNFDESFEKLSQTIKRDLLYVKAHTRYLNRANEWARENKRADLLLFGGEIDVAENWLITANKYTQSAKIDEKEGVSNPILQPLQLEYITVSRKAQNRRRFVATAGTLVGLMALIFAVGASLVGVTAINNANIATTREFVANAQSTSAFNNVITATFAQGEALVNAQQAQAQADSANTQLTAIPPTLTQVNQQVAEAQAQLQVADAQLATATQALATGTAVAQNLAEAEATLEVVNQQVVVAQATVTQAAIVQDIANSFANAILQHQASSDLQINQMNELVARYPNEASAYLSRGLIYEDAGRYAEAIADYDETIRLNPQFDDAYNNRGNAHFDLGNYEQAIANYDEAIRLNPQAGVTYNNRGNVYRDLGNYEQAIVDYDEAIRLNPQYIDAYNNRGLAYATLGDYARAIADYDETIQLNPLYAEAYSNRGLAYTALEAYEQAIADFDKALRLNPLLDGVYSNRGLAYFNLGNYEQAIVDYDEAIRLNPQLVEAYSNRGNVYQNLGEHERAIADYDEAIRLNPLYALAYSNRGLAYANLGEHEQAITDYDEAIRLNPQLDNAYYNRGLAYANLGEYEQAIANYDEAIQINPQYVSAYYNRGNTYVDLGEYEQAIADYAMALQLNPQYASVYYNRGVTYYFMTQAETDEELKRTYAQNALDDFRMAESLNIELNSGVLDGIRELEAILAEPTPTP